MEFKELRNWKKAAGVVLRGIGKSMTPLSSVSIYEVSRRGTSAVVKTTAVVPFTHGLNRGLMLHMAYIYT